MAVLYDCVKDLRLTPNAFGGEFSNTLHSVA